jgi:hypothetical protein
MASDQNHEFIATGVLEDHAHIYQHDLESLFCAFCRCPPTHDKADLGEV